MRTKSQRKLLESARESPIRDNDKGERAAVTSLNENAEKAEERAFEPEPKLEKEQLFEYSIDLLVLIGFDSCFSARVSKTLAQVSL